METILIYNYLSMIIKFYKMLINLEVHILDEHFDFMDQKCLYPITCAYFVFINVCHFDHAAVLNFPTTPI